MRIRSTKPEFWRSERISSVDWAARLVLKGLESFVDDNGVGKDDLALVVADVFPRDLSRNPPETLQKVSEAMGSLEQAGLIHRYESSGTKLLYVAFWESVQRIEKPTRGRFPRPDGTMNYRESTIGATIPEPSRSLPVSLRPGTGEQGNRGSGEQGGARDETSPPTPYCKRHPEGTDAPCSGCLKARVEYTAAAKSASKPTAPDVRNTTEYCIEHQGYPVPCDKCAQIAADTDYAA